MKSLKIIFLTLITSLSLGLAGNCQMFSFEQSSYQKRASFPAGSFLKGYLQNQLSSNKNKVGDPVYAIISYDVKIGKITCIPKNTLLTGHVTQISPPVEGRNGYIQVKFDYITFPDGWGTSLSGHVWNTTGKGMIGGEATKKTLYRKIPHYVENVGTFVQLVEVGQGEMGKETVVTQNTEFIIVLDSDLNVVVNLNQ